MMKSYVFRLIVASIIGMLPLLGHTGSAAAANLGTIKGKVTGQKTNSSMSGVDIQITDLNGKMVKNVKSLKDGTFAISQIPVGQYNVKAGKASAKSIQVAMSPPVTQVDFQVPERGYLVFSGLSSGQKIVLIVVGVGAAVAGGLAAGGAFDSGGGSNRTLASP